MDKIILTDKIKASNPLDKNQVLAWVNSLPSGDTKILKPNIFKVGDILMHPIFHHPYVLLRKNKDEWICSLLTSDKDCAEILVSTSSRFLTDTYFTCVLFTMKEPNGKFMGVYENSAHLIEVLKDLKNIFKLS